MSERFDQFLFKLRLMYCRFSFGAQAREETWRLLADLCATGLMLNKSLETTATAFEQSGHSARATILRDIEGGIARNEVGLRVRRYVHGAEALVFNSIGKGDTAQIFTAAARLASQQNKLSRALRSALAMPVVLTLMLGFICYIMGSQLFPLMESLGTTGAWPWYARWTSNASQWFASNMLWVAGPILAICGWLVYILPRGVSRWRVYADRFIPFSLYKLQQGTAFVFTVVALGRMGQTFTPQLFDELSRDASPYLQSRIKAVSANLTSGSFGAAMQKAGYGFPSPDLITVCVALDGTDGWIDRFSDFLDRWLEQLEQRIKERVAIFNTILMILIAVILAGVAGSLMPLLSLST